MNPTATDKAPTFTHSAITVTELNSRVRSAIERQTGLLWVAGEISNLVRAASGHLYFSLKDANAQVRCVMFRQRAQMAGLVPANGMQVEVRATPSLYEPRGDFQLGVEAMRQAGAGALFAAFEQLKARLAAEGLFEHERKKPLPLFPAAIGIVTSLKAAALQDVLATLKKRAPMIPVVIYPCAVQGAGAGLEIAAAIRTAAARREVETLIVCRGGGSMEDLWSFNEEVVARAIVQLQNQTDIAVVSGVGHETDFSICDFVADVRATTPTAAAQAASPDRMALLAQVQQARLRGQGAVSRLLASARQRLDLASLKLQSPAQRLQRERERMLAAGARLVAVKAEMLARHRAAMELRRIRFQAVRPAIGPRLEQQQRINTALRRAMKNQLERHRTSLASLARTLHSLSHEQVLARGFAIVRQGDHIVRRANQVKAGAALSVQLSEGSLMATVNSIDGKLT